MDEHDIRDELLQILEKTGYGEYIFEQPTLKSLLLDQIRQEIFTKLPLYSLDSQNYAEDTEEYRLCQQRITTCLESIRVLQNFTDDYLSSLIEKLAQSYPVYSDEYEQQQYSEIEIIYEEFRLLLNKFGFQFFTQEFVRFSLSASDAPPETGMVNGKLLFLICLRTFICDQERVKEVRYLLDLSKQNIF